MKSNTWETESFLTFYIEDATKNRKVFALVEGLQDDENFWEKVFSQFSHKKIRLDFPHSASTKETGKGTFMKFYPFLEKEEFKNSFVICRDSDSEYLYENAQKQYFSLPNVFHTYTYSIENHNCVPQVLAEIAKEILRKTYPFEAFFERYSLISFPLLLRYFWLKEQVFRIEKILKITEESQKEALNKHKRLLDSFFTETVLKEILKFDIVVRQLSDIEYFHAIFQEKISQKCAEIDSILIRENRLTEKELYAALTEMESSLSEKIIPHEAHYYWNGHIIFDKLLMPLFQQIRGKMVEAAAENMGELFKKFRNKAMEFDLKTKLKEAYKMSFEEIEHNPFMQKMREDIRYAGF